MSKKKYSSLSLRNNFPSLNEKEKDYCPLIKKTIVDEEDPPLTKETLGRYTWSFLHTIAVNYSENPTREEQKIMNSFLINFADVYPCEECRYHFKNQMKSYPPTLKSRTHFIEWLCNQHNLVNRRLGKKIFNCSNYEKRWKSKECTKCKRKN